MSLYGNAAIAWTSTGTMTDRWHLLDAPLSEVNPAHSQAVYSRDSLDFSTRETFTIEPGAHELLARIRYDRHNQSLMDLIQEGLRGTTLTYYPNLTDPAVNFSVVLIEAPRALAFDPQLGDQGAQTATLRFRKTDASKFAGVVEGTDLLFTYRAGEAVTGTFSRVTSSTAPATFMSNQGGNGYGTVTTAKTNAPRLQWFASQSSVGPRTFPGLLLERAETNYIADIRLGSTATWVPAVTAPTSGQTDPAGGTAAWLFTSTVGNAAVFTSGITVATSTFAVLSYYAAPHTGSTLGFINALLNSGTPISFTCQFTSGIPTVSVVNGVALTPERARNGFWRIAVRSSATVSSGTWDVTISGALSTSTGTVKHVLYGPMLEV